MNVEQEIQKILDRNFTRGDNAKALKELLVLYNVVKPKGTFCQTPDKCQMSYYHQIGDYYCSKCEKTGLA